MTRLFECWNDFVHVAHALLLGPVLDGEAQLEALLGYVQIVVARYSHLWHRVGLARLFVSCHENYQRVSLLRPLALWTVSLKHIDLHH